VFFTWMRYWPHLWSIWKWGVFWDYIYDCRVLWYLESWDEK
jgi:hypothetical protein